MSKVSTPYTSYDELMLDLDIFGTLVSQSQPDLAEFKEFLYEEYKRVHKVTLESRRYELSDVVSADFHVNYVKDIELLEDEEELSWGTDAEETTDAESEDEEYDESIYDVPTQEEIQTLKDEIVALTSEQQASAESLYGSVEVGSAENSGMVDMSFDSDDSRSGMGIASFSEEEEYSPDFDDNSEGVASVDYNEDSDSDSNFVFADELTEDELNVEIDEEEDDEEEFGADDDEDFLSSSDSSSSIPESEETEESSDTFDYEDFDDGDEEEFGADEDDENVEEPPYSEEESSDDIEDDEDFNTWGDTDESPTQEEIQAPEPVSVTDEGNEDWEQEPEPVVNSPVTVLKAVQPSGEPERKQPISKPRVARDAGDIARRQKSEQAHRNKVEKERQAASIPKSVPPAPIMPPRQEKKVDVEPKINREDEPKDLREFLRKHPHSEVSFVLKYFSKKELQKAIMSGRVIKKGSKLHI